MSPAATYKPRRLGLRAASNRALRLRQGAASLPPHKLALLDITGRLLIHFENASNRLYADTEITVEGEPRLLLSRLLELGREIRTNLAAVFDDGSLADDPLAKLMDGRP